MKSLGVGGLGNQLKDVFFKLVVPRFIPADFTREIRYKHQQGLVIHGPPGTGKTLIARAISKILNGKLQVVRGPELFNQFVGTTERQIRDIFSSAIKDLREKGTESPLHVIVIDELDSIARERGTNSSDTIADRVVNQLLTMIDGYSGLHNILLVGTTNRLELIDKALLRPGRFDLHLKVGLPDREGRLEILRIIVKRMQWAGTLGPDVDLPAIAGLTDGFSGADLEALIQTAFSRAMNRYVQPNIAKTKWEDIKIVQLDIKRAIYELTSQREGIQRPES
ncbi:vesicle-fusing ATPase-like [Lycium barbarum]|uniref:vesicle-fusing ATPase-like n=1 Tax=Lycium barbarum TaxID=112863 RepID=UPI00293F2B4E|nr:vesicle-fusing ATPase-like [Lycium barbarum]